jgi:hypothetical protein
VALPLLGVSKYPVISELMLGSDQMLKQLFATLILRMVCVCVLYLRGLWGEVFLLHDFDSSNMSLSLSLPLHFHPNFGSREIIVYCKA